MHKNEKVTIIEKVQKKSSRAEKFVANIFSLSSCGVIPKGFFNTSEPLRGKWG
jgi:hypothetical protein